ncbi:MAG: hypothetical protein ACLP75_08035, partial [Mycobacterium sp.]|uniref:hypothetical protein n=1 Tax=Mycobacterium sp. TaxID=1785 RepID=UPI003F984852
VRGTGIESVTACQTARPNLLSPNLCDDVDIGRLGGALPRVTAKRRISIAANAELRRLIREEFEQGIHGEQLAEAAGLSVPRVYQIRDGRR